MAAGPNSKQISLGSLLIKFKGGTIEMVIKLIIFNTFLLLLSDFTHFLGFLGPEIAYMLQMVFRLAAMCAIAFCGLRFIVN